MSIKCEICGKKFKTAQGLRGHKNFTHNLKAAKINPIDSPADHNLNGTNELGWYLVRILRGMINLHRKQLNLLEKQSRQLKRVFDHVKSPNAGQ